MAILKFKSNLKCNGCVNAISPYMNSLNGIKSWKVDLLSKPVILEVEVDTATEQDIIDTVQKAGYKIELINS